MEWGAHREDSKTGKEERKEIEKLYSYAGTTKKEYDERKRSREKTVREINRWGEWMSGMDGWIDMQQM